MEERPHGCKCCRRVDARSRIPDMTMNTSGPINPRDPLFSGGTSHTLELWGGVECTVNRVGDIYFDQMERSGHATRLSDLCLFAGLGIRAIRYPVLWERVAPDG